MFRSLLAVQQIQQVNKPRILEPQMHRDGLKTNACYYALSIQIDSWAEKLKIYKKGEKVRVNPRLHSVTLQQTAGKAAARNIHCNALRVYSEKPAENKLSLLLLTIGISQD